MSLFLPNSNEPAIEMHFDKMYLSGHMISQLSDRVETGMEYGWDDSNDISLKSFTWPANHYGHCKG